MNAAFTRAVSGRLRLLASPVKDDKRSLMGLDEDS